MKNNSLILKLISFISIIISISIISLSAKELNFKATEILTFDRDDKIIGKDNAEAKIEGEIEIFADKFTYYKKKNLLIAEGNVIIFDLINNIKVNSEKVNYDKLNNKIITYDKSIFKIENKYIIKSSDVNFDINK